VLLRCSYSVADLGFLEGMTGNPTRTEGVLPSKRVAVLSETVYSDG